MCVALFKGFTTAVENSNPGYQWNWDEKSLVGKKLCGVFGLEEYEKQDGTVGVATKLIQFRSLNKLPEVQIPKVKLLDGTFVDYDDYQEIKNSQQIEVIKGDKIDDFINENLLD